MKVLPWILVVVLVSVLLLQCRQRSGAAHGTVYDTIPIYDTITHDSVVPRDSVILRHEVVKLPVVSDSVGNLPRDSAPVMIPITRKHYKEDDFEAWVSGFRAELDSIRVFPKSYYLRPKPVKSKRWVLSAGVSMGYNPFMRRFEPTVGLNLGVKLWEW